ncbi:sterol uptake control protein 2 [Colletotrichum tofieldiae]|uniref:Sterol uptake control protein 2 n=1 Tax=Colletotrichum tofieldiae TaxID=708197 RepID=A0A166U8I1_9PEZI|nr:sterol uptake control protein 2 [Colletotrichum tofieldiae]
MDNPDTIPPGTAKKGRRPHKKSRTGCIDCRIRRVKCSEEKPACRSCIRRRVSCEYFSKSPGITGDFLKSRAAPDGSSGPSELSTDSHRNDEHQSSSLTSPSSTPFAKQALVSAGAYQSCVFDSAIDTSDMALLHHWTISTSLSIYKSSDVDALWQVVFPQIGFKHPFVLQGILSLSALHLAYKDSSNNSPYVKRATHHHKKALQGFQQAVSHVTDDNSNALFAWSLLNAFYVFGILGQELRNDAEQVSSRFDRRDVVLGVEWIPMMRGVVAVLGPTSDYIRSGPLKPLMSLGNWDSINPDQTSSEPVDGYLCSTREAWQSSTDSEVYDEALWILRKCYLYMQQFNTVDLETLQQWCYNRGWAGPMAFIQFAPEAYFTLLHQRQPPALVLFAFFGAIFHEQNGLWFFEDLGRRIVCIIDELLGSYWTPWMEWPLERVRLNDSKGVRKAA